MDYQFTNYSYLSEATVADFLNNVKILCVDKALLSNGKKNTVQANQWLDKCCSDSALSETMDKRWYADFKHGCPDTNDAELILANCKLKLRETAEELRISERKNHQ